MLYYVLYQVFNVLLLPVVQMAFSPDVFLIDMLQYQEIINVNSTVFSL